MEELVFIGNVNKGLPPEEVKKKFHIPAGVIVIMGAPEGLEKTDLPHLSASIKWGVYLPACDFPKYEEQITAIEPKRIPRKVIIIALAFLFLGLFLSFNWWQWLCSFISWGILTAAILFSSWKLKNQLEEVVHEQKRNETV